jgi:DNA-binding response OmpR family regulator
VSRSTYAAGGIFVCVSHHHVCPVLVPIERAGVIMSDGHRILLVKNEPHLREVLVAALVGISRCEVSCADDEVAAVHLLRAATDLSFDLVIYEFTEQTAGAGLVVAREIRRKRRAGIIVIARSSALAETARLSGFCDTCILVPFRLSALLNAVQDLLILGPSYGEAAAATKHDGEGGRHPGRARLRPATRGPSVDRAARPPCTYTVGSDARLERRLRLVGLPV